MLKHLRHTKGLQMIVPDSLSPQEIFRLIKNGDCAVFQFESWLASFQEDSYVDGWDASDEFKKQGIGPVA
jgi:hypothetical protein